MHPSWDDLETRLHELLAASPASGTVGLLVVRAGGGAHDTPARISLHPGTGIQGDRWSAGETPDPQAQVSLIAERVVRTASSPLLTIRPTNRVNAAMALARERPYRRRRT